MPTKWGGRDVGHGQSVRPSLAVSTNLLYALVNILWQRTINLKSSNFQHIFILSFTTRIVSLRTESGNVCVRLCPGSVTFNGTLKNKINLNYI